MISSTFCRYFLQARFTKIIITTNQDMILYFNTKIKRNNIYTEQKYHIN